MNYKFCLNSGVMLLLLAVVSGCRGHGREDTVLSTAANPSHTRRATVILRQYFVDGKLDKGPTTYVLLDKDSGKPNYDNGQDFNESEIILKPSNCGPLTVQWVDDNTLRVICSECGIALAAVGEHPGAMGPVRVQYEGFPSVSSWEGGANAN